MPGDTLNRIPLAQTPSQSDQYFILRISERRGVAAFEFDADRKIIAAFAALPVRDTGMPGALVAGYELNQGAVAADEKMRRHLQTLQRMIIRVRSRIDSIGEQFDHAVAAEFVGRQTDVVDHQ